MKISYSWLKDYVNIKLSPEQIIQKLTMAGLEVIGSQRRGDDFVFEIEVTTNRPDWLSVVGIARELAAICGLKFKAPKVSKAVHSPRHKEGGQAQSIVHRKKYRGPSTIDHGQISIVVEDKTDCNRYIGRVIKGIKVGPPPKWLKDRIESVGMRSVNNIVDITNFCLLELGQPLHAFDLDKLKGPKIIVRRGHDKEEIVTIDGQRRILDKDMLVIADASSGVALAGIMGGQYTEVSDLTENILLESAYFKPELIRSTSKRLAISTESSFRFERFVDFDMVKDASLRAAELILDIAGGEACDIIDISVKPRQANPIALDIDWANNLLGVDITQKQIERYLKALGFFVSLKKKRILKVSPPSFRRDVSDPVDLAEDIARIYGFDNIKTDLPNLSILKDPLDFKLKIFNIIRDALSSVGFYEVITYSLVGEGLLHGMDLNNTVVLKNPLSEEQGHMRTTIMPSIIDIAKKNINKANKDLRLFEISNVYQHEKGTHAETTSLAVLISGDRFNNWQNKKKKADFFDIKGALEAVFERLGIPACEFVSGQHPMLLKGGACLVKCNGEIIGICGKVDADYLSRVDIKEDVFVAEVSLERLLPSVELKKIFKEIPKFPEVVRDISIVADKGLEFGRIYSYIKKTDPALVRDVILFDQYVGQHIPPEKRGLSFSIHYRSNEKTLTDEEVNQSHSAISKVLVEELGVLIR